MALGLAGLALACGADGGEQAQQGPIEAQGAATAASATVVEGPHDVAVLTLTDLGVIRIELLPELAPLAVENFVKLANAGYFDGTYFHRVIPGFMIQGGDANTKDNDPRNDGKGDPGYSIPDEFTEFPHVRGVVSMANKGRNSGGSQFFIVQETAPHLDGKYSAFGRVVDGMEVVDAVTELEIDTFGRYGPTNRPYPADAALESVRIEPAAS